MKFMIILRGNKEIEKGALPTEEMLDQMNTFNEKLVDAGVMVGGDGLHPPNEGVTVAFKGGQATVTKGASPGVLVGFWLWKTRSLDEAIDWVKKIPGADGEVEIRQVFETEEFSDIMSPEAIAKEKQLFRRIAEQNAKAASAK
jgi:hypothetical protein